jgi:hypothetical protein
MPAGEDFIVFGLLLTGAYFFYDFMHIPTHNKPGDFEGMRSAGQLAAKTLAHVEPHIVPGVGTPYKLPESS